MPYEVPATSIPVEQNPDMTDRAFRAVAGRIDIPERTRALGLDRSNHEAPVFLPGASVAQNGGYPWRDDLPDLHAWILPEGEWEAFAAEARDADSEWGWFPLAALERQRGGSAGNLCIGFGTAKGVMDGFVVVRRAVLVDARTEASYHFSFDRAYLLPRARGAGLAAGPVALASLVAAGELDQLARAMKPVRGKATLSVHLDGAAESPGGNWMLRSLADEFEDICEAVEDDYEKVRIDCLNVEIDPYEPDDDDAPAP